MTLSLSSGNRSYGGAYIVHPPLSLSPSLCIFGKDDGDYNEDLKVQSEEDPLEFDPEPYLNPDLDPESDSNSVPSSY